MIRELPWRILARILSIPAVACWLIARAQRTPYTHITGPDGTLYMCRWWLFNPYPSGHDGAGRRWGDWLPSVRVHYICRPDSDRHRHSHPWNARTLFLRGWYFEELPDDNWRMRLPGQTGRLLHTDYHRIDRISNGGVWTLFITWRKRDTWYFDVDGVKVPWRKYLGLDKPATVDHHPV